MPDLRALSADAADAVRPIRRDLHAHPELGYEEVRTSGVVQRELAAAGVEFCAGLAGGTGVLGYLPATRPGAPTVALRADMDALPILEETGLPYASETPGKMHACGHDGHTSVLLGTARVLAALEERPNHVLFVFQPAEEGGAGGLRMVEDGVLQGRVLGPKADAIFGLHGWSGLDVGHVTSRIGPLMAATDTFRIEIRGSGCHAATPHAGVDPIVVAAQVVTALQTVASRNISPVDSVVVTVGKIHAGTATNIIPDTAVLEGTLRTLKPETREKAKARVSALADGVAQAFGAEADTEWSDGYPTTVNEAGATERLWAVAKERFGAERVHVEETPIMGGEDFSFYGREVPACFFFLGLRPVGAEAMPNLHSPRFDFNDDALPVGIEAMSALALSGV